MKLDNMRRLWYDGRAIKLGKCDIGDLIAFSSRGLVWRVMYKATGGPLTDTLIIESENGSTRVHDKTMRTWDKKVIVLHKGEDDG